MNNQQKVAQLRGMIQSTLSKIIGRKCILLDAPYYHNIGDVLIWTGVISLIRDLGIDCLYTASYETCTFPDIDKSTTILFNGGGNLGDIYHEHAEFLISVAEHYPNNRIIVLPQTVYYKDKNLEKSDYKKLLRHDDLYFCCRDKTVYDNLNRLFGDRTFLLPDMAFCIDYQELSHYMCVECKSKLIIDRVDVEKGQQVISKDGDVSDWPVFEHSFRRSTFLNKLFKRSANAKIPFLSAVTNRIWNWYAPHVFRKMMVKEGVKFISPYHIVETTRLHGCILSVLLNKQVTLVNNSYGKNKNFYDTWLVDDDNVNLIF